MTRRLYPGAALAGGALLIFAGPTVLAGQSHAGSVSTDPASPTVPAAFGGHWDYNDALSINAGTGRREQVPTSATARTAGAAGAASGVANGRAGRDDGRGGRAPRTALSNLIQEAENFVRDLLEVPEALTIRVAPGLVTFTDDLERERTYPTDGRSRSYHLSASRFSAKAEWDGAQLRREISGGGGFRIHETYFLSDDARRLFVIIRVKAPQRPGFVAGYNRVYDRVGQAGGPAAP